MSNHPSSHAVLPVERARLALGCSVFLAGRRGNAKHSFMLVQLTIQNVVLIEHLVLELHAGFNVLAGETGAGKSMVIDAVGLVLGGRARPDLVRGGAREAEVEAL